jgi:heme/copper-type cytochrome/quinol oxidase subunit 3
MTQGHLPIQDLSDRPSYGFGTRMTTWWGGILLIVMESAALALALGSYLYIALKNPDWPLGAEPPGLLWSSLLTVLMLLSLIPATMVKRAANGEDKRKVQILLVILCTMGVITCVLRGYEFTTLNVAWDDNVYGSLVWFILGLHTTHIVADLIDTFFVTGLMVTGHTSGKRFSAVEDDALFVYFIVAAWIPVYAILYWFPRVWSP